ncbi:MAG TPA: murein hydrolase activator NlpD [Arsenophonus nasoniae]|uniref:murein hydrolase activator NlpD n=1 Tax=Arsenophonus nasoniae TaxID=638 RepID=UPI00387A70A9
MNFNSPKFAIRWATISIITGIMLIGCSTPYHPAAPISSVHDSSRPTNTYPAVNASSKSTRIPSSPKNISVSNQNSSIYQPVMPAPKTNTDGRIIYNRNYDNIQKGSYSGNTYTVKRGDTLFYIAWITGNDYRDLAQRNKITEPYSLNVGQVLNIDNSSTDAEIVVANRTPNTNVDSQPTNAYASSVSEQNSGKMLPRATKPLTPSTPPATTASSGLNSNSVVNSVGKWRWPAEGKVIESFSDVQGGNKGVDIAGSRGQPVFATAAGRVVYSGNALRGYGNLIIIKHNDDYLSAYAHNDTILVRDQQEVQAGQKIATMGSSGTSSVRLHFEIRYKGKSVNPLRYLSQR